MRFRYPIESRIDQLLEKVPELIEEFTSYRLEAVSQPPDPTSDVRQFDWLAAEGVRPSKLPLRCVERSEVLTSVD